MKSSIEDVGGESLGMLSSERVAADFDVREDTNNLLRQVLLHSSRFHEVMI